MAKVTVSKVGWEGMPANTNVGDSIEVEDGRIQQLLDRGHITRADTSGVDNALRAAGEGMVAATNAKPTAVTPVGQQPQNAPANAQQSIQQSQTAQANQSAARAQETANNNAQQLQSEQGKPPLGAGLSAGGNKSTHKADQPKSPTAVGPMTTDTMRSTAKQ